MGGDTLDQLPMWAKALVESERVGHLGLLDGDGRPRVLPVTYALCESAAWTIIDNKPKRPGTEPARIRWLRRRPHAALTIDHYADDWSALGWLQLIGAVDILEVSAHQVALAALADRYVQYRADPPPGPLLRLRPERALWWRAAGE
jgi:PPOX class probable F420-dependent enzyme